MHEIGHHETTMPPPTAPASVRRTRLIITLWVVLLLIAIVPRVIVSQPFQQNSYRTQLDEGYSIKEALAFGTGDLNPHRWTYPTLYPYLLALSYGAVYVVGNLFGVYAELSHFAAQFFSDPRVFMWAGRVISIIAGVGGVLAVKAIGDRVFGPVGGWTAGFGLALSPLHVKISAGAMPDALAMLFAILAVGALAEIAHKPTLRGYALAGVFIGLGAGTKYWPVALALIGVGLHIYLWFRRPREERPRWSWLAASAGAAIGVFFLTSPYLLIDGEALRGRVASLNRFTTGTQQRPPTEPQGNSALQIIPIMVRDGGWLWLLASIAGLIWALVRPSARRLVVAASALLLVGIFAQSDIAPADYLLPAFPFLWILAGGAVAAIAHHTAGRSGGYATALAGVAVLAAPLLLNAQQAIAYSETDTRTIGERLFHAIADDGDTVFVDFRSIQLENSREDALNAADELEWFDGRPNGLPHRIKIWRQYREYTNGNWYQPPDHTYRVVAQDVLGLSSLPVYAIPFGAYEPPLLQNFAEAGIKYIVFSQWLMDLHIENELPLADFYQEVVAEARLVGKVSPERGIEVGPREVETGPSVAGVPRNGPTILIYEVPGAADTLDLTPLREEE